MDPSLVGEGALAHVRLMNPGPHVGQLIDKPRRTVQFRQLLVRDTLVPHLQLDVGDDGAEVRVAAPLAHAVDGPLDVVAPLLDGSQGVSHGQLRVIVAVDPERRRRHSLSSRLDGQSKLGR